MNIVGLFVGEEATLVKPCMSQSVQSGIDKKQVQSVYVDQDGCSGDENIYEVHGGVDRAVLAYSLSDYVKARKAFPDMDFEQPAWGENMLVSGFDEANVTLGEVWAIGDVRLQVTMPRKACFKLDWRLCAGVKWWANATGCGGWFLRCLTPGIIKAGDSITVVEKPYPSISVASLRKPERMSYWTLKRLTRDTSPLGDEWKKELKKALLKKSIYDDVVPFCRQVLPTVLMTTCVVVGLGKLLISSHAGR